MANKELPPEDKLLNSRNDAVASIEPLTGLRFFAALSVIFVHALNEGLGRDAGYEQLAASAVAFFFVLSGFILTYVYDQRLTWSKVPEYLVARWARIWPLHLTCLVFIAVLFSLRGYLTWNTETVWRFITNLFLVQSWIPILGWPLAFNGPAWSISTELGFYLAFPLLLIAGRRRFWPILLGTALVSLGGLAWLQYRAIAHPEFWPLASEISYCHPLIRVIDFVIGMATGKLFLLGSKNRATGSPQTDGFVGWCYGTLFELLALGVFVGVGWAASRSGPLHFWWIDRGLVLIDYWSLCGGAMLLPFAFLIWVLAWSRGMFAQFLRQPLIVWLGEVSFAFYLVQIPVISLLNPWFAEAKLPASVVVGMVIGISLAVAILLHLTVELPYRTILREAVFGNWKKAWGAVWDVPGNLTKSGAALTSAGLIAVALIAGGFEVQQQKYRTTQLYNRWDESRKGKEYLRIEFDREAMLLSCSANVTEQNNLEISLLWESLPNHSRGRFLHVTNSEGRIIFQPPLERRLFAKAEAGQQFSEKITLEAKDLPSDGSIGIGFYDRYAGTSPITGGSLGMNGRRLEIVRLQGGKAELIPQK
jgi:peptidoglycan/LPS O-acetylase OafA/YrhL